MCHELTTRGYKIYIAFPEGSYVPQFKNLEEIGVETFVIPMRTKFFKTVFQIRKLLKVENIHFIHSHKLRADVVSVLSSLFLKNVRIVTTIHVVPRHVIKSSIKKALYFLPGLICYKFFIKKIFTVSSEVKRIIEKYYFLPSKKVFTTLNSISFEEVKVNKKNQNAIRKEYLFNRGDILLVCAGALSYLKGQDVLINSLLLSKNIKKLKLILLGDGPSKHTFIEISRKLNISDKVIFPGYRNDVYDWMSIATIYIQPSVFDALPRAMLEAMYLGVPTIATDIDTMKDVIVHEKTGLLSSLSPESISKNFDRLIDDEVLRKNLSKNSSKFIKENCSMETMVDTITHHLFEN